MNKKRWAALGILAGCVAALIIGCGIFLSSPKEEYGVNQMRLFKVSAGDVKKININTPESEVAIYRGEDGLLHFEGSDLPVDQGRAESIVTFASYMYVTKEVEKNAEDLVKYGLDPPESVITVTLNDGTQYIINYGSLSTDKTARYLTLNDERTVYTQGELSSQIILKDLDSLRNLDLPEHNTELLASIYYQNFAGEEIEMNALPPELWIGDCTYQMNKPAALFVPETHIEAFKAVLRTAEFFEYKGIEILPEYGLDNPKKAEFAFSDGVHLTLSIGAKEEGANRYYCMADGKPGVYTISANAVDFMNYPALKIALTEVMPGNFADTAQITLNYKNNEYKITAQNGVYKINGKEIAQNDYQEIFDKLKRIKTVDFTNEALLTDDEIAVVTQSTQSGLELEVKFYNYGTEFAAADYGAGAQIYCDRGLLIEFLESVAARQI